MINLSQQQIRDISRVLGNPDVKRAQEAFAFIKPAADMLRSIMESKKARDKQLRNHIQHLAF